jgi:hypothetical protein
VAKQIVKHILPYDPAQQQSALKRSEITPKPFDNGLNHS